MIWILLIPVLLLLFIISYLLLAPFYIEIDSRNDIYKVRFHAWWSAGLEYDDGALILNVKVARRQQQVTLLDIRQLKLEYEYDSSGSIAKIRPPQIPFKKIKAVIKSFMVKKCYITFDTGDMPTNGILYPWFNLLSIETGHTISVNFWEENEVVLQIQNNMARILWAFVRA